MQSTIPAGEETGPHPPLIAFVLCALVMLIDGLDTVMIGMVAPAISQEWHLDKAAMTPAFTLGVVGLMLSGLCAGPLADRVGRRPLIIGAVLMFGCANLATLWCTGIGQLTVLRAITGLGLGAAMPCTVALVSELAPLQRRGFIITCMYAAYTLGGAAAGWLAAAIVPQFGWRAMFGVGALLPLALLPLLLWRLPESLSPRLSIGLAETSALRAIVSPRQRHITLLLWLGNGCGLMVMFTLINWLPSLLHLRHVDLGTAASAGALFQAGGGLGALLIGWMIDRWRAGRVTLAIYAAVVVLSQVWLIAMTDSALLLTLCFGLGVVVMGGQTGFQVLATQVYQPAMRATGLSWMQSVGRLGGVLGIQGAGWAVAQEFDAATLLQALAVPAAIALLAIWLIGKSAPQPR